MVDFQARHNVLLMDVFLFEFDQEVAVFLGCTFTNQFRPVGCALDLDSMDSSLNINI